MVICDMLSHRAGPVAQTYIFMLCVTDADMLYDCLTAPNFMVHI